MPSPASEIDQNPYAYPVPHNWADIYSERYLKDQLFPEVKTAVLSFDRSKNKFVKNHSNSSLVSTSTSQRDPLASYPITSLAEPVEDEMKPVHAPSMSQLAVARAGQQIGHNASSGLQLTQEMIWQAKTFKEAVYQFKQSSKGTVTLDLDKPGTWDDLLADVKSIEERYKSGQFKSGKFKMLMPFRKGLRNLSRLKGPIQPWLDMVPDGIFGEAKIITGGIRLVLQAASTLQDTREETYKIIEQIPLNLANAGRLAQYYKTADALQAFVSQLYVAVVESLTAIILWYQQSATRHLLGPFSKGLDYGKQLKECLERLQKIDRSVDNQSQIELHGRIDGMDDTLSQVSKDAADNKVMTNCMYVAMNSTADILRDDNQMILRSIKQLSNQVAEQQMRLHQDDWEKQQKRMRRLSNSIHAVRYNPSALLDDLQKVLRAGLSFERSRQNYAASMLISDHVQTWLSTRLLCPLIINAHHTRRERVSSVSLFSCMLVRFLDETSSIMVLTWFCGVHTEDDDCINMLLSLIGQILDSPRFDPSFLDTNYEQFTPSVHQCSAHSLVEALRTLICHQLESSPISIILDSASFYESSIFFEDMSSTLEVLLDLCMEQPDSVNAFKLLLTSPGTLTQFGPMIDDFTGSETLNLSPLRFSNTVSYQNTLQTMLQPMEQPESNNIEYETDDEVEIG